MASRPRSCLLVLGFLAGAESYVHSPLSLRSPALAHRHSARRPVNGLSLIRAQQKPSKDQNGIEHGSPFEVMMDSFKQASSLFGSGELKEDGGIKKGDWPSLLTIPVCPRVQQGKIVSCAGPMFATLRCDHSSQQNMHMRLLHRVFVV
jgi:hypothetical protein